MRISRIFVLIFLILILVNMLSAKDTKVVTPDSIRAEDYARFINERIEFIADYLVIHEKKMPNLISSEHQAGVDSLKYIFKIFRSDIEELPALNGNSNFKKASIKTITDIISILGDDFPDLHKAARDIIKNNAEMGQYNQIHDRITIKLNKTRQRFYSEYEIFLIENNFYQEPLPYDRQIGINEIQMTLEDFLNAMNKKDPNLIHFFSNAKLKEINTATKEMYKYSNFRYSFINVNPEYSIALVKIVLLDKPASYDIWFKVEKRNNQLYLVPAGFSNNKIIPWLYIRNSQY